MTRLTTRGEYAAATAITLALIGAMWAASVLGTVLTGTPDTLPTQSSVDVTVKGKAVASTGPSSDPAPSPRWSTTSGRKASRSRSAAIQRRSGTLLSSTAYCETGLMANGQRTHRGAVAANTWPLGTVLHVSDSPYGPGTFVVADRYGWGTSLDFAIPGDCAAALRWGRQTVRVEVVR